MEYSGIDLIALAPGAHMRWLLGVAPHPGGRACLLLVGPETAGFVMPFQQSSHWHIAMPYEGASKPST